MKSLLITYFGLRFLVKSSFFSLEQFVKVGFFQKSTNFKFHFLENFAKRFIFQQNIRKFIGLQISQVKNFHSRVKIKSTGILGPADWTPPCVDVIERGGIPSEALQPCRGVVNAETWNKTTLRSASRECG